MKKKRFRGIALAAIALFLIGGAVWGTQIEPAGPSSDPATLRLQDAMLREEKNDGPRAGEAIREADKSGEGAESALPDSSDSAGDENEAGIEPGGIAAEAGSGPQAEPGQEPQEEPGAEPPEENKVLRCTFEIRCDTLANNPDNVENEAIRKYIPADGVILAATEMEFTEGETVFDALKRVTRAKDIQMEFRFDNLYTGGAYIEGINYLYEFDGGVLSGWMYKVNGQFPNYGCAGYTLQDGDEVVWIYTCDLGADVGDNSHWRSDEAEAEQP